MGDAFATLFEDIDQDYAYALNNPETDAVGVRHWRDVVFAHVLGFRPLMLYVSVPPVKSPPLIVFIHGGAWRLGHPQVTNPIYRRLDFIGKFLRGGFAVAKISYRLSGEDRFPTQLHDCKAAIRFLRNRADVFGFRPNSDWQLRRYSAASGRCHLAAFVGPLWRSIGPRRRGWRATWVERGPGGGRLVRADRAADNERTSHSWRNARAGRGRFPRIGAHRWADSAK